MDPNLDAVGLAELVSRGAVSPRELVREALRRLEAADALHHFVAHRFDAEAELGAMPSTGRFRGVPFLLKDQLEVAGQPVTYGTRLLGGYRPSHTHPLARRFAEAGLVVLGRTTMSELGLLPTTESRAYGDTHNPWAPGHSPGGSSGGAAVAVAAGVVPMAHAADGGGSIRIPASACGLVGLKPSRGREPRWPDDPPQGFVSHFAVTRSVRDAAALLDVVRVDDGPPFEASTIRPPGSLRIGLTAEGFWGEPLHADVHTVLTYVAARLGELGHHVEPSATPVDDEPFAEAFQVLWCTAAGVFLKIAQREAPLPPWLRRLTASPGVFRRLTALGRAVEPFTRRLARVEAALSPSDLWLAEQALDRTSDQVRSYFEGQDLWLTATMSLPPPRHGFLDLRAPDDAVRQQLFGLIGFTPIANATGIPAISLPGGLSSTGLPIGIQLMAPWGREDRLLAVARQLEQAWGWPTTPGQAAP